MESSMGRALCWSTCPRRTLPQYRTLRSARHLSTIGRRVSTGDSVVRCMSVPDFGQRALCQYRTLRSALDVSTEDSVARARPVPGTWFWALCQY
eukprot:3937257-Rhodomonas_salina.1